MKKFIVIKTEDAINYLSEGEKKQLVDIINKIDMTRFGFDKPDNEYAVINKDEDYYEEIEKIMIANGHNPNEN